MNEELMMKIAVITDDGKTISQHFGRAAFYMVLSIEEGKIIDREMRDKLGHNQFSVLGPEEHHHEQHGLDDASHNKHAQMAGSITDCQALLCGGMGMGAYESMRRLNIQPIVTDLRDIESAAQAYLEGKLVDHTEKLH
jgi:predicted Fe-Mo cluster-binding NifX family protein